MRFSNKTEAWNFLWEKVRQFELCPKLCGLQVAKGLCFNYQTGECKGACMCVEHAREYNLRLTKAIDSFTQKGDSAAIIGRGRTANENSLILVNRGSYFGFGYFSNDVSITDFESAKTFVRSSVETPTVQNLINSYLTNPRGTEVVRFSETA
jgi:DNA polymerase-3 subunit epsilon